MSLDESEFKLQGSERLFEGLSSSGAVLSHSKINDLPDNLIFDLSQLTAHLSDGMATNFEELKQLKKKLVAANT